MNPQPNQYNADDFLRYHRGTMPAAERHALEKAALEDIFLADALEGFLYSNDSVIETTEIKNRLSARLAKTKQTSFLVERISRNWIQVAALFILLAGAGWGVLRLFPVGTNDEVAYKKPLQKGMPQQTQINATEIDLAATETAPSKADEEVTSIKKPSKKGIRTKKGQEIYEAAPTSEEYVMALKKREGASLLLEDSTSSTAALTFSGKVVDAAGSPLPLATVKAQNITTATDLSGNFKIRSADSLLNATVSASGFEANRQRLNTPAQNTIVLKESAGALNEVTALAAEKQRRKKAPKEVVPIKESSVDGGLQAFNLYVLKNKKLSAANASKYGGGSVVLLFDVIGGGKPVNIKVSQSLCPECDREAIRLLQQGPKWSSGRGSVVVVF